MGMRATALLLSVALLSTGCATVPPVANHTHQRGFKGDVSIDKFCVRLEQAHHQAIHGGGNWHLGRASPGEWNRKIMGTLLDAETRTGRMLTRNEILDIVAETLNNYSIPLSFVSGRKR